MYYGIELFKGHRQASVAQVAVNETTGQVVGARLLGAGVEGEGALDLAGAAQLPHLGGRVGTETCQTLHQFGSDRHFQGVHLRGHFAGRPLHDGAEVDGPGHVRPAAAADGDDAGRILDGGEGDLFDFQHRSSRRRLRGLRG